MHLAELPGAAALLLVAMDTFRRAGNRLAIGNARRLGIDFQLVLARHFFQLGLQVHLAEAANHRFVAGRMALDDEGRIFHRQLAEDVEESLFVALLLRFDGQPGHRLGKFERHQVDVVLVVRIVQNAIELDLVDLGDGADVTRQQFVDFDGVLALQLVKVGDLERTLAVADEELHVPLQCRPDAPGRCRSCPCRGRRSP